MNFKEEIIKLIAKETKLKEEELINSITIPPDPRFGDYAFPCFKLGKDAKEEAKKLEEKLKKKLGKELPDFVSKVEVAGPYLNFFISPHVLAEITLKEIYKQAKKYGSQNIGKGKNIVIDFSSPNIAKPFGIGHLRSTVIGNSLYQIYSFLNYKVIGANHLGDWGTQFGKLIVAYKKWGDEKELEKDPIKYLLKLYVKFHDEADKEDKAKKEDKLDKDLSLNDEAREAFKKLEDGDKEHTTLWELFRKLSLQEFKRIYKILDVHFDTYNGEAFYTPYLKETIERVKKSTKTEISEGALIVNLEKENLPPFMLQKSDKATTYHTRDLAAAFYRLKKYNPEKVLYVVGSEQKSHFRQLFKVLELVGVENKKFAHVDFGLFRFPEGKMSTRKGKVIFLEEVLDKSISLAEKIIEEKNPNLKNKKEVAEIVGVGAIIFADLSNDRIRNIEFSWDKMLSFEGETSPYIQYTHARACSILKKAEKNVISEVNFEMYNLTEEMAVVKLLYEFPEVIIKVLETYKPHHLAQYLISLAQSFNEFYHKCPVISKQKNVMKARLLLVNSVRQVLENGLNLLGIKAPEEM